MTWAPRPQPAEAEPLLLLLPWQSEQSSAGWVLGDTKAPTLPRCLCSQPAPSVGSVLGPIPTSVLGQTLTFCIIIPAIPRQGTQPTAQREAEAGAQLFNITESSPFRVMGSSHAVGLIQGGFTPLPRARHVTLLSLPELAPL